MQNRATRRRLAIALQRRREQIESRAEQKRGQNKKPRNLWDKLCRPCSDNGSDVSFSSYKHADKHQNYSEHQDNERSVANATVTIARFTIVLAGTAIIGAYLTYQTLGVIERQLKEMKSSSAQTDQSIAELRKQNHAFNSVQRAFVFPIVGSIVFTYVYDVGWSIVPIWRNSGNTPAVDLNVETHCVISNNNDPFYNISRSVRSNRLLAPHQDITGTLCHFDENQINIINNRIGYGYVWLVANYNDVFGDIHTTEVCIKIMSIAGDISKKEAQLGTVGGPCPWHNCADEECKKH